MALMDLFTASPRSAFTGSDRWSQSLAHAVRHLEGDAASLNCLGAVLPEDQRVQEAILSQQERSLHSSQSPGSMDNWPGTTVLITACYSGAAKRVESYLKVMRCAQWKADRQKAFVNQKDCWGNNALHVAVENGHSECVRLLMESGLPDLEAVNKDGRTALLVAASKRLVHIASLLLPADMSCRRADTNAKDGAGRSVLETLLPVDHRFVDQPTQQLIHLLLQNGAMPSPQFCRVASSGGYGDDVMWELMEKGYVTANTIVCGSAIVPEDKEFAQQTMAAHGVSPLFEHLLYGVKGPPGRVLQRLLCLPDTDDAIMRGVQHRCGFWDSVEKLPLAIAEDIFTREGTALTNLKGWDLNTPLWVAAKNGNGPFSRLLLRLGADATIAGRWGTLPFVVSMNVWNDNEDLTLTLLDAAVDNVKGQVDRLELDVTNGESRGTALVMAASRGYQKVVGRLCELGVDVTSRNKFGWSALSAATRNGHLGTALLLARYLPAGSLDLTANRCFTEVFDWGCWRAEARLWRHS
jgi:ankyrin repeat protein